MNSFKNYIKGKYLDYFPSQYKNWFFKKYKHLDWENILAQNVEPEVLLLDRFLTKDSVFIDVGANNGAYLYVAEKKIKQENIIGFEPNPLLATKLKRMFSNVRMFEIGLSNQNGVFSFKIPSINDREFVTRGTLNVDFVEENETTSKLIEVKTMKLDDLEEIQQLNRIDLIKIDVEGFELSLIEGAVQTIEKYKPKLIVEIEQRHHQIPLDQCIEQIVQLGYKAYYLDRNTRKLKLYTPADFYQKSQELSDKYNYINNFVFSFTDLELS